jgi:hypothetical protein
MWWRALYLILFLAVNILWFHSIFEDAYATPSLISIGRYHVLAADGRLIFRHRTPWILITSVPAAEVDPEWSGNSYHGAGALDDEHVGGMVWEAKGWSSNGIAVQRYHDLRVSWLPIWVAALPSIVLAGWPLAKWLRARRQPGRCRTCGYDLRATPEFCPECGRPVAADERVPQ